MLDGISSMEDIPAELIELFFRDVDDRDLVGSFTVSSRWYAIAHRCMVGRVIAATMPRHRLFDVYVQMISVKSAADDWQARIRRNYLLDEVRARRDLAVDPITDDESRVYSDEDADSFEFVRE